MLALLSIGDVVCLRFYKEAEAGDAADGSRSGEAGDSADGSGSGAESKGDTSMDEVSADMVCHVGHVKIHKIVVGNNGESFYGVQWWDTDDDLAAKDEDGEAYGTEWMRRTNLTETGDAPLGAADPVHWNAVETGEPVRRTLTHQLAQAGIVLRELGEMDDDAERAAYLPRLLQISEDMRMLIVEPERIFDEDRLSSIAARTVVFGNNASDSAPNPTLVNDLQTYLGLSLDAANAVVADLGLWGSTHGAQFAREMLAPLCGNDVEATLSALLLFAGGKDGNGAFITNATPLEVTTVEPLREQMRKSWNDALDFYWERAEAGEAGDTEDGTRGPFFLCAQGRLMERALALMVAGRPIGSIQFKSTISNHFAQEHPTIPRRAGDPQHNRPPAFESDAKTGAGVNQFTMHISRLGFDYSLELRVVVTHHPMWMTHVVERSIAARSVRLLWDDVARMHAVKDDNVVVLTQEQMLSMEPYPEFTNKNKSRST
jgi:hypothetical protein